jgi:hypothetical protein
MVAKRSSSAPTGAKPHDFTKESAARLTSAPTDLSIHGKRATPPRVDLADPAARAQWLDALHEAIRDGIDTGLDATDAPGRRMVGRKGAREIIEGAGRSVDELFAAVGYVRKKARKPAAEHDTAPAATSPRFRRASRKRGAP